MNKNIFFLIFIAFALISCGFKVAKNKVNFTIGEINTDGDKRVNYILKNNILQSSSKNNVNSVNLDINTKKTKTISERNIKNEITKYNIKLDATIILNKPGINFTERFTLSREGVYNVDKKNSTTINNEKKLMSLLTINLSEQIIEKLVDLSNDF